METSALSVTLVLLTTVSVISASTEWPKHVGCYTTNNTEVSQYSTSNQPIAWKEMCIKLCAKKMMKYAGIQERKHLCYCGNDLIDQSNVEQDTFCSTCGEDTTMKCGGEIAMSLYQLSDSTSFSLLLATDDGIKMLKDNVMSSVEPLSQKATDVGYHFKKQEIYYISGYNVLRSVYVPELLKYSPATTILDSESYVVNLAVDWKHDRLYLACEKTEQINFSNLDGTNNQVIIHGVSHPEAIAYDSAKSAIFCTEYFKVTSCMLNICNENILKKYWFKLSTHMAIDTHQELVYVIGSYENDNRRYLASTDYDASVFRIIHSGPELSNPFALDVFNDQVVWGNQEADTFTIYNAKISDKCRLENLTIAYEGRQKINSIKIYGADVQTSSTVHLCQEKACSHSCTAISQSAVRCNCPSSMVLDNDGRTCSVLTTTLSTANNPEIPDLEYDNEASKEEQFGNSAFRSYW